jgi:hypothetical protein
MHFRRNRRLQLLILYNFSFSKDLQVNKGFNLQLSPTGQKVERAANELLWRLAIDKKENRVGCTSEVVSVPDPDPDL